MIDFAHPANRKVVAHFHSRNPHGHPRELDPAPYPELNVAASRLDLADFGPEWIFGDWLTPEDEWCRAAFEFAGE